MKRAEAAEKHESPAASWGQELPWEEALTAQHQQVCCESLRGLLYTEEQAVALLGKAL
ncbi:MAG: hypothetical protein IT163_12250 [Bryobacterales bacterium]|nr:hypothetical protein [Bryobacterales bacterium]